MLRDQMTKPKATSLVPTESDEQQALFTWAKWNMKRYPELELLTHIPNGGLRNVVVATKLKAEGTQKGFPDIILPVARQEYHGLAIELKRAKGGRLSEEQKWWLENLSKQGWLAVVCRGAAEAIDTLKRYLK